jgi:hypothetical protein
MRLLVWRVLVRLAAFDLMRLGHDFQAMHRFIRSRKVRERIPPSNAVEKVCDAVNRACVWYPRRVRCLQRSVVTVSLLRHFGVPARMAMGAQTYPFAAHAWAEVDGRAVNEHREVQKIYVVWERC